MQAHDDRYWPVPEQAPATRNSTPGSIGASEPNLINRRFPILLLVLLVGFGSIGLTTRLASSFSTPANAAIAKFDEPLAEAIGQVDGNQPLRAIFYMHPTQGDLFAGLPQGKIDRRIAITGRLQQAAAMSQSGLQPLLQQFSADNQITFYRALWIINGLQVTGDAAAITALAARPEVARVKLDVGVQMLDPVTPTIATDLKSLPWHLQRIRAPHAWFGLGITGTGTTIAVMDTGVDWRHSVLAENYLGLSSDSAPNHDVAWFDALDGSGEPFDPNGHGTHVAGTASGRKGIGVAPGSKWMAVRILGPDGIGYSGDIHAGFQWLLAPNGDPSQAPDIVNGSWSGWPLSDEFHPDLLALQAAGIIPVFAAGNAGPFTGTVRSPANLPGILAVGATDDTDSPAWFSSRGPSPWTAETKPTISAPGMGIVSSLPGQSFGHYNGTSMATPQVAGILALLLSGDSALDPAQATRILTSTATANGATLPNSHVGWGRADAYAAVASIAETGHLQGIVTDAIRRLPGVAITATTPAGADLGFTSDVEGAFAIELVAGVYGLSLSSFGYEPYVDSSLAISTGHVLSQAIVLNRLPYGAVDGRLFDIGSGRPVSGVVRVTGTPVEVSVGSDGQFSLELPAGDFELVAWVGGHRLGRQQVTVSAGDTATADFWLESGPSVLLIDSGQWYGLSQIGAYFDALEQNDYAYTLLAVRDPYKDKPTFELLSQFDVVVWSAPFDSPGSIDADNVLVSYLEAGGNLMISGQNLGSIAWGPTFPEFWWYSKLQGRLLGKASPPFELTGEPSSVFEGQTVDLFEYNSLGQPVTPDASAPRPGSLTTIGLRYPGGAAAALLADRCEPFHLAYFGFGLEDVAGTTQRNELVSSTFAYFAQPDAEAGLRIETPSVEALVPSGTRRVFPIELMNLSETITDTFTLELVDADWPSRVVTDTVEIGSCQVALTRLEVDAPQDLPQGTVEKFELIATSTNSPEHSGSLEFHLKTPGQILLVDDDRWYDQAQTFADALADAGLPFDYWENPTSGSDPGSPPADLLAAYDFILWFTGYDWFRPVTREESASLLAFVQQGGRLFLTSQDYMYYHRNSTLTREYLGVRQYVESMTPTLTYGGQAPFDTLDGPHKLDFAPYQNHGDGLVPSVGAIVSLWHDKGYPAGVANSGPDWRTVFWGVPLEKLPETVHARSLNQIMGWLGDLGDSTFVAGARTMAPGSRQAYTLTLRYSPAGPGSEVVITNTVPMTLTLDPTTLTGGASYDHTTREVTWRGYMQPGQIHELSYRATAAASVGPGASLENTVELYYQYHELTHDLVARSWINAPDLSQSRISAAPAFVEPGRPLTIEMHLVNEGNVTGAISATLMLPAKLSPISSTLIATDRDVTLSGQLLSWQGWLEPRSQLWATLVVTAPMSATPAWLPVTAYIEDGMTQPVIVSSLVEVRPHMTYFPIFPSGSP